MAAELRHSTCNRDCPDACGLLAEVEDGQIRSLRGQPDHPVTRGFLCFRTSRFPEFVRSTPRVTQPLLRKGGELVPVTMAEALDVAAERLLAIRAESGPAAIFHYRSGGSLGLLKAMADRLFERFGPCATKVGDICSGAGEAAQIEDFGISDSNDLDDLRNARHVLIWGKNPFVSNVHLVPVLKEARAAGAALVAIDPISHKGTAFADRHHQPRPGGDLALALGVGAALLRREHAFDPLDLAACSGFDDWSRLVTTRSVEAWAELAGVPAGVVVDLADRLADGPTAILVGWGMQRRRHGGAIVRALDALSAVTGNLFRSGGGCSFYFARRRGFDAGALVEGRTPPRVIREPLLGEDVLAASDPPIRAMWITAGNPVCMLPGAAKVAEAIERTEFVVVVDPLLTDTARRADLVLPVPTLLEDDDLVAAYGHHFVGESRPLVDPPEGVLQEVALLQQLAERLGIGDHLAGSIDEWKERLLAPMAKHGVDLARLRERRVVHKPEARPVLFADRRVDTPDGKVQLLGSVDETCFAPEPVERDGLWLFSNSSIEAQASQWSGRAPEILPVTVHPDAAPAGLGDGDPVEIVAEAGSLPGVLRLDASQRPDVALVPKGGGYDRGTCANVLIPARATDLGLGAAYLDCRVELRAR